MRALNAGERHIENSFGDEAPPSAEPEPWRPPVGCPRCHDTRTRLIGMHYEMSVYECELCGLRFEMEENEHHFA